VLVSVVDGSGEDLLSGKADEPPRSDPVHAEKSIPKSKEVQIPREIFRIVGIGR